MPADAVDVAGGGVLGAAHPLPHQLGVALVANRQDLTARLAGY
ncbi:MAG: hypothetical protein ABSA65_14845 [Acidimicrobiales bacterium]